MSNAVPLDCDVLIVGAGPTGATLALTLAQQGNTVIIIEREKAIYPLPRAVHVDDEIMRIFQNIGVADAIAPFTYPGSSYEFRNSKGEVLLGFAMDSSVRPYGWSTSNMIYQPGVESELHAAIAAHSNIMLHRGLSFTGMIEDADGVTVTVNDGTSDQSFTCQYLVGCDGARSPVREAAGIEIDDLQFNEPWLVIDTVLTEPDRLHLGSLQICDPNRPTTSIRISPVRHRWEFMLKDGETAETVLSDEFIADLLKPWNVEGAITIERKAVYTFQAIVAKNWRKGRVLIAGDAAHQMPPFAGQGMCSGLRDSTNIAWKLDAILKGTAAPDILDSYQVEREPNVRAIIGMALMMGRTVCITNPEAAAMRDAKMLEDRKNGISPDAGGFNYPPILRGLIRSDDPAAGKKFPQPSNISTRLDDILGPGACLITQCRESAKTLDPSPHIARVIHIDDDHLMAFTAEIKDWMARQNACQSVLIRPDRYIFGTGQARDLLEHYTQVVTSGHPKDYGAAPMAEAA